MLVSELENLSLSSMISGGNVDYLRLHDSLCQCGREMLAKYEQKQESSKKLAVKTQAVKALLNALGDKPENPLATRITISAALESHAAALQGHEHLLSVKGNTYALMEQTKALRKHGQKPVPASLLQYHDLKNKLLGPDTFLNDEQIEAVSELAEKQGLTLKTLKLLEVFPRTINGVLVKLHKSSLLEPDLCAKVLKHQYPVDASSALVRLHQENLLGHGLCANVLEYPHPSVAAISLVKLHKAKLLEPNLYTKVLKHKNLDSVTRAILKLHQKNLLEFDWCARVFEHQQPLQVAEALVELHQINMLESDLYTKVLEHQDPSDAAIALAKLHKGKLLEPDWCARVLEHNNSSNAAKGILKLNEAGLLKPDLCVRMLQYEKPYDIALTLNELNKKAVAITIRASSETEKIESLYKLLATSMVDDIQGFFEALQSGQADTIAGFIKKIAVTIAVLPLSEEQKAELLYRLLTNKDINDIPGFFITLQNGHSDAITAFIHGSATAVTELLLPEKQKAELLYKLLSSKRASGTPGFFMALQMGHSNAIITFVQASAAAINSLHLSEEKKAELLCELLGSKKADGTPGFFMALQDGRPADITHFILASAVALDTFSFSEVQKAKLLCELLISRRADGTPGFFMVLQNGCLDSINAFIQASATAIASFSLSKEEIAELLYGLFDSIKSDKKPFFWAVLNQSGPAVAKAFAEGIDRLPIPDEKKEKLKQTQP